MALEDEIINIEDLEIASEVKIGDYILLETTNGTRLLDFKDFIVGLDNITFFDRISGTYLQTTDISAISAKAEANHNILTTLSTVSARVNNVETNMNSLNSSFTTLVDSIDTSSIAISDISSNTNAKVGFSVSTSIPRSVKNSAGAIYFDNKIFTGSDLTESSSGDIYLGTNAINGGFFYKAKGTYGMLFNGMIGARIPNSFIGTEQSQLTINKNDIVFATFPLQLYSTSANQRQVRGSTVGTYQFSIFMNLSTDDKITLHISNRTSIEPSTFTGIKIL